MFISAQVSRVTDAVLRFSAWSLVVAAPMSAEPASHRRVVPRAPLHHALFVGLAGVSALPQRRLVQRAVNVLRHAVVRRAKGRRHEHHHVERCSP